MSTDQDEAQQAAIDTEVTETDSGFVVSNAPEESILHQHDTDRIPERDITQEMLSETGDDPESWLTYGGNYEQHRHTTCEVITPDNVGDLGLEYLMDVGAESSMEGTPLIVPGDPPVMYQSNGPNHLKAIDAREGEVLWSYTYPVPTDVLLCCDDNNRGVALYEGKVFMTTLDSGVQALDRYTGEELWYTSTEDHEVGYSATWAPIVHDGVLYTGSAGGEYGVRGFHCAIDTDTGEEIWRTLTNPEEEWVGDSIEQSCGTQWMTATLDEERGKLHMPVGNPGPDFDGSVRPGPNRNTCGTLSLDLETGDREWFYQETPHDVWDYDSSCPRVLIRDLEIPHRDQTRDAVISAGKTSWVYAMDPETGQLIERSEPGTQQLNMYKMVPHIDEGRHMPFVPGAMGGNDWQPSSYNPELGLMFFKMQNQPHEVFWEFEEYEPGELYFGGIYEDEAETRPDGWNEKQSSIVAIDPATGERVWREWIESDYYIWGGSLSTASGLMFTGTQNGEFVAYDGESGDRLWQFDFDEPVSGDPVSWYDPETDKQYVAIQVGGSGWLRKGPRGDSLAVFSMEA